MFVFLSPGSVDSKWIHFEAGCAYARDIQVVPVCLPGMDLNRVTPPLGLLQGFNLHSSEAMGNIARVCNEEFLLKMDEGFTGDEFKAIFENADLQSQTFYGKSSVFIEEIMVQFSKQLPQAEPFKPFDSLAVILERSGAKCRELETQFEFHGCNISLSYLNQPAGQALHTVQCNVAAELFHVSAPFLDTWHQEYPGPWRTAVVFKYGVQVAQPRHQLTSKLYNSPIEIVGGNDFCFQDLKFSLQETIQRAGPGTLLCFDNTANLLDKRLARVIDLLFDLQVLCEPQVDF
jgi:hypothetical protein